MTEKNIKPAFRGARLVPLDPERVVSKLDVRLRTPTPAEEVASLSTPWVSKTPKTVLEAQFQCEYLDRRIRRHQSSSPESILGALKSLAKGTKAIMHENALIRAENQDLGEPRPSRSKGDTKSAAEYEKIQTAEERGDDGRGRKASDLSDEC
jgi:hypothetical protein